MEEPEKKLSVVDVVGVYDGDDAALCLCSCL